MNLDQWFGAVRALWPVAVTLLVAYNVIPSEAADQVGAQGAVIIGAASGAAAAISVIWSIVANSTAAKAKAVIAEAPGTVISVSGHNAPKGLEELAKDPTQPNITIRPA